MSDPCPTCEGRCCVNKHGSPAEHGAALALHSCPDCEQGMNRKPCPECKGKCCRDQDYGYRVEHMGAESYEHVCDYCVDGDKYVPVKQDLSRNAHVERQDVVAWLRDNEEAWHMPTWRLAEEIEKGTHEGWAKKEKA